MQSDDSNVNFGGIMGAQEFYKEGQGSNNSSRVYGMRKTKQFTDSGGLESFLQVQNSDEESQSEQSNLIGQDFDDNEDEYDFQNRMDHLKDQVKDKLDQMKKDLQILQASKHEILEVLDDHNQLLMNKENNFLQDNQNEKIEDLLMKPLINIKEARHFHDNKIEFPSTNYRNSLQRDNAPVDSLKISLKEQNPHLHSILPSPYDHSNIWTNEQNQKGNFYVPPAESCVDLESRLKKECSRHIKEGDQCYFSKIIDHHTDLNTYITQTYQKFKTDEYALDDIHDKNDADINDAMTIQQTENRSMARSHQHTDANRSAITQSQGGQVWEDEIGMIKIDDIFDDNRLLGLSTIKDAQNNEINQTKNKLTESYYKAECGKHQSNFGVQAFPNYESQYLRQYQADRDGYDALQPTLREDPAILKQLKERILQICPFQTQKNIKKPFFRFKPNPEPFHNHYKSQNDIVAFIKQILPEFGPDFYSGSILQDYRQVNLKYSVLLNRLASMQNQVLPSIKHKFLEEIAPDSFGKQCGLHYDLIKMKSLKTNSMGNAFRKTLGITLNNEPVENVQQKPRKNRNNNENGDLNKEGKEKQLKMEKDAEILNETEKKLKDIQMAKLQEKVRDFIRIEQELRRNIEEVESKDDNLITIVEQAVCFGQVIFELKPLVSIAYYALQKKISGEFWKRSVKWELQDRIDRNIAEANKRLELREENPDMSNLDIENFSKIEQEIINFEEVLKETVYTYVQDEFSEVIETLKERTVHFDQPKPKLSGLVKQMNVMFAASVGIKKVSNNDEQDVPHNLLNTYAVLTPKKVLPSGLENSAKMTFYKDMHLMETYIEFPFDQLSFFDTGISMKYKQHEDPLYFIKMVFLTTQDIDDKNGKREIYYMALAGDQIAKWEPCLKLIKDPDEPDSLFNQMKEKLVKSIQKKLNKKDCKYPMLRHYFGYEQDHNSNTGSDMQRTNSKGGISITSRATTAVNQRQTEFELKQILDQKRKRQELDRVMVGEAIDYLQNGAIFLKYGKRGQPHPRHIYLVRDRLYWRESSMMGKLGKKQEEKRSILLDDDTKIIMGRQTPNFKRFQLKLESEKTRDDLSFSIDTKIPDRYLDLEGKSQIELDIFVTQLRVVVKLFGDKARIVKAKKEAQRVKDLEDKRIKELEQAIKDKEQE